MSQELHVPFLTKDELRRRANTFLDRAHPSRRRRPNTPPDPSAEVFPLPRENPEKYRNRRQRRASNGVEREFEVPKKGV